MIKAIKQHFEVTPEKMKAKLLADAERELVEAEHMARMYAHRANAARETIEALRGKTYVAGINASDYAELKSVSASLSATPKRDFIGA